MPYDINMILCIDATRSMQPFIEDVKKRALSFPDALIEEIEKCGKICRSLKIKVISFRDYYNRPDDAIVESDFFQLPGQERDFACFVNGIVASGGGNHGAKSGLEALYQAINSDWNGDVTRNNARKKYIVIWTDGSAHPLVSSSPKPSNYPYGMPKDFDELTHFWYDSFCCDPMRSVGLGRLLGRIIIFAPDTSPWTDIVNSWSSVIHMPTPAGSGLEEIEFQEILYAMISGAY